MMKRSVGPQLALDEQRRQLFHPNTPHEMYHLVNQSWIHDHQKRTMELKHSEDCCSPESISYGNVSQLLMQQMEYQLYNCSETVRQERSERKVATRRALTSA